MDPTFTSALFRELTRRIGSSLLVGSAYPNNTKARTAERANGVLGDTLRAFANGRKDDGDVSPSAYGVRKKALGQEVQAL